MKVQLKDKEIRVRFRHSHPDGFIHLGNDYFAARQTICEITCGEEVLASANSICSFGDQFCKSTGRKISLKRAVGIFDKEGRTLIWKAYLNR